MDSENEKKSRWKDTNFTCIGSTQCSHRDTFVHNLPLYVVIMTRFCEDSADDWRWGCAFQLHKHAIRFSPDETCRMLTSSFWTLSNGLRIMSSTAGLYFSASFLNLAPGTQLGIQLKLGKNSTQWAPGMWPSDNPSIAFWDSKTYSWLRSLMSTP